MTVQWVAAGLVDQKVIASLPGVDVNSGMLQRTISNSETATLVLNLDGDTPENWEAAIDECATVLACYDDADPTKAIMWAGTVTSTVRDAAADQVQLSLVTFEGYFERAYVGDATYDTTTPVTDIIADLMTSWWGPSTGITLNLDYTAHTGKTPFENIVNNNTDMNTVKTVLDNVCALLGAEYTVEWDWAASGTQLAPRLVFGTRIGQAAVGNPQVTFEMPGVLVTFTRTVDYSTGVGANRVIGYSSGQGSTTPLSDTKTFPAGLKPGIEYRYTPAQSVSPGLLSQYVGQAVSVLGPGSQPITMSYHTDQSTGRRYGVDWHIGDDLGYRIPPSFINEQGVTVVPIRAFPNGAVGLVRAIGVQLDIANSLIAPVVYDPTVYTDTTTSGGG